MTMSPVTNRLLTTRFTIVAAMSRNVATRLSGVNMGSDRADARGYQDDQVFLGDLADG
jgi:hypothetical protein